MSNICDEEGEANGGVFVGDSIVSIFSVSSPFPKDGISCLAERRFTHIAAYELQHAFYPRFKIGHENKLKNL